jgi:cytochrome c oxidase subunit 2
MLAVSAVVYLLTMAVLLYGIVRPRATPDARLLRYISVSTALSVLILVGLVAASATVGSATSRLQAGNALHITVTGYQWWWRADYHHPQSDQSFTTANELHIPIGRTVQLTLTGADVIHSFWVPNLHGKRDLIPGEKTTLTLRADRPGTYRGQCAEFCGYQHAHMALLVVAEPEEKFAAWYANQLKPAQEPSTEEQKRGQQLFLQSDCSLCHTIRGTIAGGRTAPDLTHLKSRATIAAATLPNTRGNLGGWIANSQTIKPGNRMPPHVLPSGDLNALLGYLESLK